MPDTCLVPGPAADRRAGPALPRVLREELFTVRRRPLPPLVWPRRLRWLPHTLVVLAAVALGVTGEDAADRILAAAHAGTLVVALRHPVPALWASAAVAAVIGIGHPPTPANEDYVWMVHAGILFLLALRVRTGPVVVAALLGGLLAAGLEQVGPGPGSWPVVRFAVVAFAGAVVLGVVLRSRREARARLTEQIAATAQERALRTVLEERARIARELHDVVAHHLSVIAIRSDAAPLRVADPPRVLVAELAAIRADALEGLGELRRLLGVLRSSDGQAAAAPLGPQPTLERLDDLVAAVRAAGLDVAVRVGGPRRALPPGVELSAYRIVQEALSNVLRHAPGSGAGVHLDYGPTALGLRVVNGPPTRAAAPSPGAGHGLLGMRERAAVLGGDLAAGPTPDGGYEVAALLPAAVPTTEERRTA